MALKRVLITGGTRGIGLALVKKYALEGYAVAFTYVHSEEKAQALKEQTGAIPFKVDTSDEQQVISLKNELMKKFHGLDVVVVNAGVSVSGCFELSTLEDYNHIFDVNVKGAYLTARIFSDMLRNAKGNLIFISSMWGQVGASCEVLYSASKSALIGMTKALAKEMAPDMRVNCVAPGVVQTDMMAMYDAESVQSLIEETPLLKLGMPMDVANAVFFLTSQNASFITGHILHVNGGFVI